MFTQLYIVDDIQEAIRLSDYVHIAFPFLKTRSAGQKAIKKQQVLINGTLGHSYDWIKRGDKLLFKAQRAAHSPYHYPITILYEDDDLAIIQKPAGVNVSGNRDSLSNHLHAILKDSAAQDALFEYTPVHRLDKDTMGLLMVAKSKHGQLGLHKLIEERKIYKGYTALVIGKLPNKNGTIVNPINGQKAISHYTVVSTTESCLFGHLSLVKVLIETGRKHQIRIHMSSQGTPILGDKIYCNHSPIGVGKGMFLFANELSFEHPTTGEHIELRIAIPPKVERVMHYYGGKN